MPRLRLLLLLSLLSTAALAAGPGQPGGPGSPMGEVATPCPAGWTLHGRIQRGGGFSCTPAKGSPPRAPELAVDCPVNTRYFIKGRRLGCEPLHATPRAKRHLAK